MFIGLFIVNIVFTVLNMGYVIESGAPMLNLIAVTLGVGSLGYIIGRG